MNELQIDKILTEMKWTRQTFRGVYSSDTLPRKWIERLPCAFVVNTDKEHQPGSHWTAIYMDEHGHGEYFDSYGLPPLSKSVLDFLEHQSKSNWTFNTRQLQGSFTTMCGGYCIFFIMYRCLYNMPMEMTINHMFPFKHAPLLSNDVKVQRSLKQRFGLYIPLIEMDLVIKQLIRLYKQ